MPRFANVSATGRRRYVGAVLRRAEAETPRKFLRVSMRARRSGVPPRRRCVMPVACCSSQLRCLLSSCTVGPRLRAPDARRRAPGVQGVGGLEAGAAAATMRCAARGGRCYGDPELNAARGAGRRREPEPACRGGAVSPGARDGLAARARPTTRRPRIGVSFGARAAVGKPLRQPRRLAASDVNDYAMPLDVAWEPDLWGRIRRSVESSTASAQASAADVESTRLSLQAELAADYFQLRALDADSAAARPHRRRLREVAAADAEPL